MHESVTAVGNDPAVHQSGHGHCLRGVALFFHQQQTLNPQNPVPKPYNQITKNTIWVKDRIYHLFSTRLDDLFKKFWILHFRTFVPFGSLYYNYYNCGLIRGMIKLYESVVLKVCEASMRSFGITVLE